MGKAGCPDAPIRTEETFQCWDEPQRSSVRLSVWQCVTLLVPWGRDRDRLERAAAVGAQTLLRAGTASSYQAFFLLKRRIPMKEMERLKEMAFGDFK